MPLQEVDWDNYIFRCHYFGELMTPSKGKSNLDKFNDAEQAYNKLYEKVEKMKLGITRDNAIEKLFSINERLEHLRTIKDVPTLSDTCKRRLAQIYTEETTGRKKEIESDYLEKGLKTEEQSITIYSLRTGKFYRKNKEKISNGYVIGEIDFDDEDTDTVIDTKSSFDIFTFDATIASGIKPIYDWQGQCYMWLKNRKNFRLAFCLNNTPKTIIGRMIRRLEFNFVGDAEDLDQAKKDLIEKHTYDDLPLERKIRIYDVKRDDEKIELAKMYIPHFRNWLKNITNSKFEEDGEDS